MCCLCFTLFPSLCIMFSYITNKAHTNFPGLKVVPKLRDSYGWVCRSFLEFPLVSKCWLLFFSLFIAHPDAMPWSPAHHTSPAHDTSPHWGFISSQIRLNFWTELLLLTLKVSFQMLPFSNGSFYMPVSGFQLVTIFPEKNKVLMEHRIRPSTKSMFSYKPLIFQPALVWIFIWLYLFLLYLFWRKIAHSKIPKYNLNIACFNLLGFTFPFINTLS